MDAISLIYWPYEYVLKEEANQIFYAKKMSQFLDSPPPQTPSSVEPYCVTHLKLDGSTPIETLQKYLYSNHNIISIDLRGAYFPLENDDSISSDEEAGDSTSEKSFEVYYSPREMEQNFSIAKGQSICFKDLLPFIDNTMSKRLVRIQTNDIDIDNSKGNIISHWQATARKLGNQRKLFADNEFIRRIASCDLEPFKNIAVLIDETTLWTEDLFCELIALPNMKTIDTWSFANFNQTAMSALTQSKVELKSLAIRAEHMNSKDLARLCTSTFARSVKDLTIINLAPSFYSIWSISKNFPKMLENIYVRSTEDDLAAISHLIQT